MKTGIVRRIDELGRVVIPKEIRKTMRLRNGEELEIFTNEDGLVLKKYSSMCEYKTCASDLGKALRESLKCGITVTDCERVVFCSPDDESMQDKSLSADYNALMEQRKAVIAQNINFFKPCINAEFFYVAFVPVLAGGDLIGSFAAFSVEPLGECQLKALQTAAAYIAAIAVI